MATASTATAAPATETGGLRAALSRIVPAFVTVAGVAAVLRVVYDPWFLNYDARYSLLWARDAWQGHKPDYLADFAPTPHPLQTAVSSLALPFGDSADQVVTWGILLCFGALVWLTYRLGAALFSPWVGAVAAVVVLTRPALERDAVLAYQDVPFAALVVGAVLLEVRRPRRGVPVLALLALAGLLRPEAWVLAGAYALYASRGLGARRRAAMLALAAVAPVLWALSDWIVTGDVLHSLHGTSALAEAVDRRRDIEDVPYWTAQYFGYALREPLVLGVPIGLAFAWRYARRPALLPLAVVAAMTAVFAVGPLFGLPLIRRYVSTPSVLLTLFYGLAVCGWILLPRGSAARRRWLAAGALAAALSVVYLPWHYDLLAGIERRIEADGRLYADLKLAAEAPPVRAAFSACAPLTSGDRRPIPFARWWLDGPPGSVTTVTGGASPMGRVLLMPRRGPTTRRIYGPRTFPKVAIPADQRLVYRNASWEVYAEPGCGP
jgi:hypothetical protein